MIVYFLVGPVVYIFIYYINMYMYIYLPGYFCSMPPSPPPQHVYLSIYPSSGVNLLYVTTLAWELRISILYIVSSRYVIVGYRPKDAILPQAPSSFRCLEISHPHIRVVLRHKKMLYHSHPQFYNNLCYLPIGLLQVESWKILTTKEERTLPYPTLGVQFAGPTHSLLTQASSVKVHWKPAHTNCRVHRIFLNHLFKWKKQNLYLTARYASSSSSSGVSSCGNTHGRAGVRTLGSPLSTLHPQARLSLAPLQRFPLPLPQVAHKPVAALHDSCLEDKQSDIQPSKKSITFVRNSISSVIYGLHHFVRMVIHHGSSQAISGSFPPVDRANKNAWQSQIPYY